MKALLHKIHAKGDWAILGALVVFVALLLFGVSKFVDYKMGMLQAEINQKDVQIEQLGKDLDGKVTNLESMLLTTASSLESVLRQEQERNNNLKEEFENITSTVTSLEKLSNTDPELLKKYSKVYFLNEHYVPVDLANIDDKYLNTSGTNFQIHKSVYPYLKDLFEDAEEDGMSLRALSAYRSFGTQSALKASYTLTYGAGTANRFSADQGYSEHQLGTTLDFTTAKTGKLEGFDKTPEYKWLQDNAHKYGFVISYPDGNKFYKFEPWHWRFVGIELALKLHDDNMFFYDMDQREIDSYLGNLFD